MLHEGKVAEMRTGEGKTLSAVLPAYLNALSGRGVHLITVNEYLAVRDCEWCGTAAAPHAPATARLPWVGCRVLCRAQVAVPGAVCEHRRPCCDATVLRGSVMLTGGRAPRAPPCFGRLPDRGPAAVVMSA